MSRPPVVIVAPDPTWPERFQVAARYFREVLGSTVHSVHHIGSTSVPGLASKDRIDLQLSLASVAEVPTLQERLRNAGLPEATPERDHRPPGDESPEEHWEKLYLRGVDLGFAMNVHLRFLGRANREYPLLFRDYLRAHADAAAAYGVFKQQLAAALGTDRELYTDLKDPVCDLIMVAARGWARRTGWEPGPGD